LLVSTAAHAAPRPEQVREHDRRNEHHQRTNFPERHLPSCRQRSTASRQLLPLRYGAGHLRGGHGCALLGGGCHLLVTWHRRRDGPHTRARSASVSGSPRGFFQVRRASGCACGAARRFRGRRGVTRRGAEGCKPPASGWCVCTGSHDARAAALALGTLAPGGGGLGAAGAGLDAPWEGFAQSIHIAEGLSCPTLAPGMRAIVTAGQSNGLYACMLAW
jgi:hypothetical protein